jgi:hypothetical protein
MNVNNRKLFANRDARRRLSEMGGIVASMPELLGVAQQYNQGGTIQPVYDTGVTPFDVIAQRVPGMSQREMIEAGLPRAGLMRREIVEMMRDPSVGGGGVDLNIGPEEFAAMSREERRAAGFSGLGSLNNAYFAARDRLLESQFPMQGPPMPPEPERQLAPEEYINPADEFAGLTSGMTDPYQLPEVVFEREPDPAVLSSEMMGGDPSSMEVFDMGEGSTAEVAPAPEPRTPDADTRRPVLRPDRPAPAEAEPEAEPDETVLAAAERAVNDNPDDPSGAAATTTLNRLTGGAADTVRGRVQQYEQLFQEMFGESDEDKTRERYMNLAMIGFAIASGEDPSALKNIATGMLQGTAQMREDAAVRRQREDRIKELAVAAGLEDERLAQRLAARVLAGSDTRDARNAVDFWQDRYNTTMAAIENGTISVPDGMNAEAFAADRADSALTAARSRFPTYAGESVLGADGGAATAAPDLAGMQAAEEAARTAGETEFSFGGMRYPVR